MIRFAFGANCGAFTARGLIDDDPAPAGAAPSDCVNRFPSAIAPNPIPHLCSICRRLRKASSGRGRWWFTTHSRYVPGNRSRSIHERELVRFEQHLAILLPRRELPADDG